MVSKDLYQVHNKHGRSSFSSTIDFRNCGCLAYCDSKKCILKQNLAFFPCFYFNQLFSADSTMWRNSNFVHFLPIKTWKKPSKVGYFQKNSEKFSTGIPQFMLLMWGHIKNHGKRKPCKSRLLSNIKGEEYRIEL